MSDHALEALRQRFLNRYDDLKTWLTKRLGSSELAGETLQETWLRLARAEAVGSIRRPDSYLLRTILNVALDRRRAEKRHLNAVEIGQLLHIADETADPEQALAARSEMKIFAAVLQELPPRRRAILLAARLDNMPQQEIARRLGVSLRLVSKELHLAHEYCLARRRQLEESEE